MEIINPFKSYEKLSGSLSTNVNTMYGELNIDFDVLDDNKIKILRNPDFIFPYSLETITEDGSITPKHGYFSIQLNKKANDVWDRQHFQIAFLLPEIKEKYFAVDSSNDYEFSEVSSEEELKKSTRSLKNLYMPKKGLLAIPYDKKLLKGLEITIEEISKNRWKKYPSSLSEEFRAIQADLYIEQMNNRKRIPHGTDMSRRYD